MLTRMKANASRMALYLFIIESSSKTISSSTEAEIAGSLSGCRFCVSGGKVSVRGDSVASCMWRAENRFVATKLSSSEVLV